MDTVNNTPKLQIFEEQQTFEPKVENKSNKFLITIVISIVVFAVLATLSFLFLPAAAAITFTVLGVVASITAVGINYAVLPFFRKNVMDSDLLSPDFNSNQYNVAINVQGSTLRGQIHTETDKLLSERQCVIIFGGNDSISSHNSEPLLRDRLIEHGFISKKEEVDYDYIQFDYRGTGKSDGSFASNKQLVSDGKAIVQAAIDHGYRPENIVILGFSLGGTVAPVVKEHFDQQYNDQSPSLFAYHTFYDFGKAAQLQADHYTLSKVACKSYTKKALLSRIEKFHQEYMRLINVSSYEDEIKQKILKEASQYKEGICSKINDTNDGQFDLIDTSLSSNDNHLKGYKFYLDKILEAPNRTFLGRMLGVLKGVILAVTVIFCRFIGWAPKFSVARWNALKGKKLAVGGGALDDSTLIHGSLAEHLAFNDADPKTVYIDNEEHLS